MSRHLWSTRRSSRRFEASRGFHGRRVLSKDHLCQEERVPVEGRALGLLPIRGLYNASSAGRAWARSAASNLITSPSAPGCASSSKVDNTHLEGHRSVASLSDSWKRRVGSEGGASGILNAGTLSPEDVNVRRRRLREGIPPASRVREGCRRFVSPCECDYSAVGALQDHLPCCHFNRRNANRGAVRRSARAPL